MRLLFIFISVVSITASGFFGLLTGVLLGQEVKSLLIVLMALLLSSLLTVISLRVVLRLKLIKLLPVFGFTVTCILCGLAYDRLLIPEGFKLIIIAILLVLAGFLISKSINNTLSQRSVGRVTKPTNNIR